MPILTSKAYLTDITVTNIYQSFTHKMAANTRWHRYATKWHHYHPVYSYVIVLKTKNDDCGHLRSLEQHADGCISLAMCDFLLLFDCDLRFSWNCCRFVRQNCNPNNKKLNKKNFVGHLHSRLRYVMQWNTKSIIYVCDISTNVGQLSVSGWTSSPTNIRLIDNDCTTTSTQDSSL